MGRSVGNAHTEINGGQLQTADPERKIRVLIVNRSPLMATALASLFSSNSDFEVVGQARCCADCCSGVANLAPDVVVCDLKTEDKVGAWSLERFRSCLPDVPTIVLSDDDHEQRILRVVRVGVQGFLTKDASPAKLFDAIRTVSNGGCYLEDGIQSKILGLLGKRNGHSDPYCALLNQRERHILQLMADGLTNEQIGKQVCLSKSAVKYHNSAIFKKLGVSSRAEAVKVASTQALIS
jgi:DNA-binding NarL/FixJ family response regulator